MKRLKTSKAKGSLTALVLVDSSRVHYFFTEEEVFTALDHIGLPYEKLDLAKGRPSKIELTFHPEIILAQEHIGRSLSPSEARAMVDAIRGGVGLVNLDETLETYPPPLRESLGFSPRPFTSSLPSLTTSWLKVADNSHYISFLKERGDTKCLTKPVEMGPLDLGGMEARAILEGEEGLPAMVAMRMGDGRVVQFAVSPKIWLNQVFGHGRGLDDIFWRSIVWAARKPLIMKAMPPFVTARIDDASGAHHFRYINIYNKYGYIPHISLFLDDIKKEDVPSIREKYEKGLAIFSAHAFSYNDLIYFDFHKGEYPSSKLVENISSMEAKFSSWKIKPAKVIVPHYGEWSENAVKPLYEAGYRFLGIGCLPGEPKQGAHREWKPAPYGRGFICDYLPNHPQIYVVADYAEDPRAKIYLPGGDRYFVTHGVHKEVDVLWRYTVFRGESPSNNVEGAAGRISSNLSLGLENLFFGSFVTHEQRISALSLEELDALFSRVEELTSKYDKIYKGYDYIAKYAKNRNEAHLVEVDYQCESRQIRCTLKGKTDMVIQLYVFRDEGEWVNYKFEGVPAFLDSVTKTFQF